MKILLNQRFGLGNQFFQYAAALYFAKLYGASLEIIREHQHAAISYGHPRGFLLEHYQITTPVRDRTLLDRVLRSKSRSLARITGPLRHASGVYLHDPEFLMVGEFQPALPIPKGAERVYLNGHFQVHEYADASEVQLRREFTLRHPPTGRNLELLQQIQAASCPVSINVRLGDYRVEWDGRNLLPASYYIAAIAQMKELHPEATFFVFSDEIAGARELLSGTDRVVLVDHNSQAEAHEDQRLISACRHHILANSTFSWWGAWLNPKPDKVVLAPDPWHRSNPHPHLLPPTWRRVPVSA